ncbi:hypothetical protein EJ08DRAFT_588123 [Tothia fuscella]|uniref:Uncharacterized protein n=1 Tax=Tothia fuscella TaxID=1048955 RepID=A0A9P4NRP5_9PEZI|nr:hypothetical protein EJ08DRAFT_588123 [Tothia fuscella]
MAYYLPTIWNHGHGPNNTDCQHGHEGSCGGEESSVPKAADFSLRNYNTVASIYNLTVFPKNIPIFMNVTSIGLPFFSENVTGRVSPLGNFSGYEESIEYFWGLAPVAVAPYNNAAFSHAKLTHFSTGCPEVAASNVELTLSNVIGPNKGTFITKLKEIAFWRFDKTGKVSAYDAWIPNLNDFVFKLSNPAVQIYQGGTYMPNQTEKTSAANQICTLHNTYCATSGNSQYPSLDACLGTLMAKPYGNYDETWGDNLACRNIHALLTVIRPAIHCPHIGPTGGGKCTDIDYNNVYFDNKELFGDASLFNCPGQLF